MAGRWFGLESRWRLIVRWALGLFQQRRGQGGHKVALIVGERQRLAHSCEGGRRRELKISVYLLLDLDYLFAMRRWRETCACAPRSTNAEQRNWGSCGSIGDFGSLFYIVGELCPMILRNTSGNFIYVLILYEKLKKKINMASERKLMNQVQFALFILGMHSCIILFERERY